MSYLAKSWNSSSWGGAAKFCRTASMAIGLVVGLLQGQVVFSAATQCTVKYTVLHVQNCESARTREACAGEWGDTERSCNNCPNKLTDIVRKDACRWNPGTRTCSEEEAIEGAPREPNFFDKCMASKPPSGGMPIGTGMETMSPE
jgi:hypothetical protein